MGFGSVLHEHATYADSASPGRRDEELQLNTGTTVATQWTTQWTLWTLPWSGPRTKHIGHLDDDAGLIQAGPFDVWSITKGSQVSCGNLWDLTNHALRGAPVPWR
jgi:hypothetical protein